MEWLFSKLKILYPGRVAYKFGKVYIFYKRIPQDAIVIRKQSRNEYVIERQTKDLIRTLFGVYGIKRVQIKYTFATRKLVYEYFEKKIYRFNQKTKQQLWDMIHANNIDYFFNQTIYT